MQVNEIGSKSLIHYTIVFALLLFIGLTQILSISAQKKPPLLETRDNDLSAFDKSAVEALQTGYNTNVVKSDAPSQELARQYRNRLIAVGIEQTDAYFIRYLKNDRQKREWLQFLLDFLEIGAATAIGITNGERAKTVISEGLGALQASRTSLNKNFKLLERQIIINQMVADRGEILALILERLDRGVTLYPWEAARSDLRNYFNAGTLDNALTRLSATTGKAADDAEVKVRRFKGLRIVSASTRAQSEASRSAEENKSALEDAVDDESKKAAALAALKKVVGKLEEDEEIIDLMKAKGISPAPDDGKKIFEALIEISVEQLRNDRRDLVMKIDKAFAEFGKLQ